MTIRQACSCGSLLLVLAISPTVLLGHGVHTRGEVGDHGADLSVEVHVAGPATGISGQGDLKFRVLYAEDHLPANAVEVLRKAHGGFAVDRRQGRGRNLLCIAGSRNRSVERGPPNDEPDRDRRRHEGCESTQHDDLVRRRRSFPYLSGQRCWQSVHHEAGWNTGPHSGNLRSAEQLRGYHSQRILQESREVCSNGCGAPGQPALCDDGVFQARLCTHGQDFEHESVQSCLEQPCFRGEGERARQVWHRAWDYRTSGRGTPGYLGIVRTLKSIDLRATGTFSVPWRCQTDLFLATSITSTSTRSLAVSMAQTEARALPSIFSRKTAWSRRSCRRKSWVWSDFSTSTTLHSVLLTESSTSLRKPGIPATSQSSSR